MSQPTTLSNSPGLNPASAVTGNTSTSQHMNTASVAVATNEKLIPPSKLTDTKDWPRWERQMDVYLTALNIQDHRNDPYALAFDEAAFQNWKGNLPNAQSMTAEQDQSLRQAYASINPITSPQSQSEAICFNRISSNISKELYSIVQSADSSYSMWNMLKEHCEGDSNGQRLIFQQKFNSLRLPATQSMEKFMSGYTDLIADMDRLSIKPSTYEQNSKLIQVLPLGTYRDFVTTHRYQIDSLSTSKLRTLIRSEAERLGNWNQSYAKKNPTLFSGNGNRTRGNGRGSGGKNRGRGGNNHGSGNNRGNGRGNNCNDDNNDSDVCFRCWTPGHRSNVCEKAAQPAPPHYKHIASKGVLARISAMHANRPGSDHTPSSTQSPTPEPHFSAACFLSQKEPFIMCNEHKNCKCLGIDSCAADHLINDPELFDEIVDLPPISTVTASDVEVYSNRGGTARIKIYKLDGTSVHLTLSNAYYVPDVPINLFSTTKFALKTNGYCLVNAHGAQVYTVNKQLIFDAPIRCGVPMAHVSVSTTSGSLSLQTTLSPDSLKASLWHARFGHLSIKTINKMFTDEVVKHLDYQPIAPASFTFCEGCVAGKATKLPFSKTHSERTSKSGDLFFTDLYGPFRTKSRCGNYYTQHTIDAHSRYAFTVGLHNKSQHPKYLQKLILLLQTLKGWVLKNLRSDDAGELRSKEFLSFLSSMGINLITSVAGAHEQNALAERLIRTLVEGSRVMLFVARLPKYLFEDALRFMTHVYNLRAHSSLDGKTPYELFFSTVPSVAHLRVFGAHCHVLSRVQNPDKMVPKSFPGRLIGYHTDKLGASPNGYIIYFPSSRKVMIARDVIFNEAPVLDACRSFANSYRSPAPSISSSTEIEYCSKDPESSEDESWDPEIFASDTPIPLSQARLPPSTVSDGSIPPVQTPVPLQSSDPIESTAPSTSPSTTSWDFLPSSSSASSNLDPNDDSDTYYSPLQSEEEDLGNEEPVAHRTRAQTRRSAHAAMVLLAFMTMMNPNKLTMLAYSCAFTIFAPEPRNYREAIRRSDANRWIQATKDERLALEEAGTYIIVDPPPKAFIIGSTMVYKIKQTVDGKIDRYKARLCARGDLQHYGIHFTETFAPVVKFATIRLILALATIMNWSIYQLDINSAYLYGDIDTDIYMRIPHGFYPDAKRQGKVLKLLKSLYGLKQAGKIWYTLLSEFLISNGFKNSSLDRCCFIKTMGSVVLIVLTYVDDLIYASNSITALQQFKKQMATRFKMKDLGELNYIVGIKITRTTRSTKLDQSLYHKDILSRFNMDNSIAARTPLPAKAILYPRTSTEESTDHTEYRSRVGSLMYSFLGTRPDLGFVVGQLSRYLHDPTTLHRRYADQALRYVKFTQNDGITYTYDGPNDETSRRSHVKIIGYSDADWAGDTSDSRSTRGHVICLANAPIVYSSTKIKNVCKSTAAAETAAADAANDDIFWLRNMLDFLGFPQPEPTTLFMDNMSAIKGISKGNTTQSNKYFRIRIDSLHESVKNNELKLVHREGANLPADMLTKSLSGPNIKGYKDDLQILSYPPSASGALLK